MPKSDSSKMPVNTRTTDFGGDPEIKNASISHEKGTAGANGRCFTILCMQLCSTFKLASPTITPY